MRKWAADDPLGAVDNLTDEPSGATLPVDAPDRRDGRVYVYDERLQLAVKVALATGRPLLLRGEPGCGKSSLATYLARNFDWRYYEHVLTARTQARDLLWTFDAVRKLADAQHQSARMLDDHDYVQPGALWWAMDAESAKRRGRAPANGAPSKAPVHDSPTNDSRSQRHAVVLLDEIDKADPDIPNALLVALGSSQFTVVETGTDVRVPQRPRTGAGDGVSRLLIVITTNEERELPEAFLRRCIVHLLASPDEARLVEIARRHMTTDGVHVDPAMETLCRSLARKVVELRERASAHGLRPPSAAEYLDAVRACLTLGVTVDSPWWKHVSELTIEKPQGSELDR
jgi:MoxR-like ATPase